MRGTLCVLATITIVAAAPAKAATVGQFIVGTISGPDTVDKLGYFAGPGTDLAGKSIRIYYQYVSERFGGNQCTDPHQDCERFDSKGYPGGGVANFNIPSSVLMSVALAGTHRAFAPFKAGVVNILNISGGPAPGPYYFGLQSDAFLVGGSGGGNQGAYSGPWAVVSVQYTAPVRFGAQLAASNEPLPNVSDTLEISIPAVGDKAGGSPETFTFTIARAGR